MELASLVHSSDPETSSWAYGRFRSLPEDEKLAVYRVFFDGLSSAHTDAEGKPLPPWSTRYLEELIDLHDRTVVQDIALKLNVLPRELEMMLFYVYGNFDGAKMTDTHSAEYGPMLIVKAMTHLAGSDAERILEASYYIYCLREMSYPPDVAARMAFELSALVERMDPEAPYALSFTNKSGRLSFLYGGGGS